jgi:heat shock protein HslJ
MYRLGVGVLLVCFLAACGGVNGVASPNSVLDGGWKLISGRDNGGAFKLQPSYEVTLEVDGGSMSGHAPCNSYGGRVEVDGASVEMRPGNITAMACMSEDATETEHRYLDGLQAVDSFRRNGSGLTLSGPDTELVFEEVVPIPDASFTGTDWELESLIAGSSSEGLASSTSGGAITFRADGTFEGTTGCGAISGRWTDNGDRIETSDITIGTQRCRGLKAEQHEHVASVIEAGFTMKIDENTMALEWVEGERGLYYIDR